MTTMKIKVFTGGAIFEADMTCDDDEPATLAEQIISFLKGASEQHVEIREAKRLTIEARVHGRDGE